MRAKVIKIKIMSKNKRHNDLEMKCNKTRAAHSPDRCVQAKVCQIIISIGKK